MKKFSLWLCVCAIASLSACAQERSITFNELPEQAKHIITQHFSTEGISIIKLDNEDSEYEVHYTDGTEVDFSTKGALQKVDCNQKRVPDGLLPEQVKAYVQKNYPSMFITEWGKENKHSWKAELNNGLDLIFNKHYQFTSIDKED